MKTIRAIRWIVLAALLLPSSSFAGAYANTVLGTQTANLVGYWKLDEPSGTTATDSSTGGHNGTYTGGTLNQTGPFAEAKAFKTQAVSASANMAVSDTASLNFGTGNFTAVVWVEWTGTTCPNNSGVGGHPLDKLTFSSNYKGWAFEWGGCNTATAPCSAGTPCVGTVLRLGDDSAANQTCVTGNPWGLIKNSWSMLALVRSGTGANQVTNYAKSISIGSTSVTCTGNFNVSTTGISLGVHLDGAGNGSSTEPLFHSEASVWNVALSPTEISNLFDCGSTGLNCASTGATIPSRRWFQSRRTIVKPEMMPVSFGPREPPSFAIDEPIFVIDRLNHEIPSRGVYAQ